MEKLTAASKVKVEFSRLFDSFSISGINTSNFTNDTFVFKVENGKINQYKEGNLIAFYEIDKSKSNFSNLLTFLEEILETNYFVANEKQINFLNSLNA